jgi:hypothetical protein
MTETTALEPPKSLILAAFFVPVVGYCVLLKNAYFGVSTAGSTLKRQNGLKLIARNTIIFGESGR